LGNLVNIFSSTPFLPIRTRKERSAQTAKDYFLEQASAYFDEMKHATANAPHIYGDVQYILANCDVGVIMAEG
jgi:exopolysaccharide biosynthesis predicted pyruvyltransferase EpsI